jgi:DNA-binding FadR family transcriptional regulator
VDFAFFEELAQAAGNLVFVLIMNSIRSLYFEHAELLPVTAGHEALAPLYGRAARAVGDGDAEGAKAAVRELARLQRERVAGAAA